MAKKKTSLPPPLRRPDDPPLAPRVLRETVAIFDELVRRGLAELFPDDLPPAKVRATLESYMKTHDQLENAGHDVSSAVATLHVDRRGAQKALTRLESLVDGSFPPGTPGRADFFPRGSGHRTLHERLTAMIAGIKKHGLKGLPHDLALATLETTASELGASESERTTAGGGRKGLTPVLATLHDETDAIKKRLVKMLHGHFGRDSQELIAFGLKPRKAHTGGRKKKRAGGGGSSAAPGSAGPKPTGGP